MVVCPGLIGRHHIFCKTRLYHHPIERNSPDERCERWFCYPRACYSEYSCSRAAPTSVPSGFNNKVVAFEDAEVIRRLSGRAEVLLFDAETNGWIAPIVEDRDLCSGQEYFPSCRNRARSQRRDFPSYLPGSSLFTSAHPLFPCIGAPGAPSRRGRGADPV